MAGVNNMQDKAHIKGMMMKKAILLGAALASFPLLATAQMSGSGAPNEVKIKREISFDADGDGRDDRVLIMADGCENDECPVVLMLPGGSVTLGYGSMVETGYVSPQEMGVNDPENYPAQVPVVRIDGVTMAYDGQTAFPVADLISNGYFKDLSPDEDDLVWLSEKTHQDVSSSDVMKVVGDLSPAGEDVIYSVSSSNTPNSSAWFIRSSAGNEILRGFSMDYPRIYQDGKGGYKVLSVSLSGLGVIDLRFPGEQ